MSKEILSAEAVREKVIKHQKNMSKEKREFERYKESLRSWDDLKGDATSIFKNSKMTYEDCEAKGGPCVQTQKKYVSGETKVPQLPTFMAWLRTMKKELVIGDK